MKWNKRGKRYHVKSDRSEIWYLTPDEALFQFDVMLKTAICLEAQTPFDAAPLTDPFLIKSLPDEVEKSMYQFSFLTLTSNNCCKIIDLNIRRTITRIKFSSKQFPTKMSFRFHDTLLFLANPSNT